MPEAERDQFNTPDKLARRAMGKRQAMLAKDYAAMDSYARGRAFTVGALTRIDMVRTVKKGVEQSMEQGTGYREFRKALLEKYGKGKVDEKTGEVMDLRELMPEHRLRTVYDTSVRQSYATARDIRQREVAMLTDRKYVQYKSMLLPNTRPEHRAMHNRVFHIDDPLWPKVKPLNGFGCQCESRSLSAREIKAKGLRVESSTGDEPTVKSAMLKTPSGKDYLKATFSDGVVFKVDPGWHIDSSAVHFDMELASWERLQELPENLRGKFMDAFVNRPAKWADWQDWAKPILEKNAVSTGVSKSIGWMPEKELEAIGKLRQGKGAFPPIYTVEDRRLNHSERAQKQAAAKALPIEQVLKLPEAIRSATTEVFYDKLEDRLMVVADMDGGYAVYVFGFDQIPTKSLQGISLRTCGKYNEHPCKKADGSPKGNFERIRQEPSAGSVTSPRP